MKVVVFFEIIELPMSRDFVEKTLSRFRFPGLLGSPSVSAFVNTWKIDGWDVKHCIVVGDRSFKRQMEIGIKSKL